MKTNLSHQRIRSHQTNFLKNAGLALLGLVLAGCPSGAPAPGPAAGDKVVIKGSNTIGEELAPRLIAEYKKDHPTAAFELESKGSGYGFGNLLGGGCDIAAASRAANETELLLAHNRDIALQEYVIGSYSVAVVVNVANPVGNLTKDQVRDIFAGNVKNWKDVGGPDAPINLYIRDPISGTHLGFRELAMENKPYAGDLKTFTGYAEIVKAVAQDPNGIGYSSIQLAANPGAKSVTIAGVAPTVESVNKGKYPYSRVLHLYTRKGAESSKAREFIQFVQSANGKEIKNQMGVVPPP